MPNSKRYLVTFKDETVTEESVMEVFNIPESHMRKATLFMMGSDIPSNTDVLYFDKLGIASVELSDMDVTSLERRPEILAVEEDIEMEILGFIDDDAQISEETTTAQGTHLWNMIHINAPSAWEKENTGLGVNLAILDTGIAAHPDLEIKGGVSFVPNVTSYNDGHGHGTHCAGIAAAKNGTNSVLGVARDCNLFAVKVLSDLGKGATSSVISGLEWCIDNNIKVASMSLGSTSEPSVVYATAIRRCQDAGVSAVAAAGNSAGSDFPWVGSPANSFLTGVPNASPIAVGAIDITYCIAGFSSRGTTESMTWNPVTVTAPGVNIYSTYLGKGFVNMSGTSMACPHVAGLVALVYQQYPRYTPQQVKDKIVSNAVSLGGPFPNETYGSGNISAVETVTLKCLGSIENPDHVCLDGRTQDGSVGLAPSTNPNIYSGTYWEMINLEDGNIALKCLGTIENPDHVYLDGRTQDGSVGLAPSTDPIKYSGTYWEVINLEDGNIALKCLGTIENPDHVYLDGRTQDGSVGLAPNADPEPYSGTHWKRE